MKIEFNNDALLNAAVSKAKEGNITQALKLFAKVDGYESMLNQTACLCELHDYQYAHKVYARLLSKYFGQYDCMSDLYLTGDSAEPIRTYFPAEPSYAKSSANRDKQHAREDLVCVYGGFELPFSIPDGYNTEDCFQVFNDYLAEPPAQTFFDVNSLEYFDEQYERMRKSFLNGNMEEYNLRKSNILNFTNDNSYTLQMKIVACFLEDNTDLGVKFVAKLLQMPDASIEALDTASRFLCGTTDPANKELLRSVLQRLSENYGKPEREKLLGYLQSALIDVRDTELSLKFADELYSLDEDLSILSLRLCAVAMYNAGETDAAKQVLRDILACMPDNAFALVMLEYMSKEGAVKPLHYVNSHGLPYDAPIEIVAFCMNELSNCALQANAPFTDWTYTLIDLLYDAYRSATLSRNHKLAVDVANGILEATARLDSLNSVGFEEFARVKLAEVLPEPSINASFLSNLIINGVKEPVIITVSADTYVLDLSAIKTNDYLFVKAASLCASLRKVSLRTLLKAYKTIMANWSPEEPVTALTVRQVAYCMLALGYKGFTESIEADYFPNEERDLYKTLFDLLSN